MKKFLITLLAPALAVSAFAQGDFQAKAVLSKGDGETFVAFITAATKTQIRYKVRENAVNFVDAKIADFTTIYLMQPDEFGEAMDLYEGGKYKEALEKFVAYKTVSKSTAGLKNNFHTLAAFYEMECMRHLGDYAGISTALQSFMKEQLVRDDQLRQLDLYVMWDAVKAEAWDRLLIISREWDDENLADYQRVQVAYCKGLALQKTGNVSEAVIQYSIAMTVDAGASANLAQAAALNSLQIYFEDEEVQTAITNWETDDENKASGGYARLLKAATLAKVYNLYLKRGKALPDNYAKFLKYEA